MKSNLKKRSNVYWRQPDISITEDHRFLRQVRGLNAVRKLLVKMVGTSDHRNPEVRRCVVTRVLSYRQALALRTQLKCARCDTMPEGIDFRGQVDFRCGVPGCMARTPARSPHVSIPLLQKARTPLDQILANAIEQCHGVPPPLPECDGPRGRVTVRVSRTVDWLYSDEELAAFLSYGLSQQG
jgi:hypothetical protein